MTNKELLEDLLIEFDELGMEPTTIVPNPSERAIRWKRELMSAIEHLGAEWISVGDKNPEDVYGKDREKITVLVCTKSGKVSASTRCARYSYDYGQNTWVRTGEYEWSGGKKVTHWRPMPDPPHQQDDRQERI